MANQWMESIKAVIPACQQVVPSILSAPNVDAKVGEIYNYNVDTSGYPFATFSLINAPAGMIIHRDTGDITWRSPVLGVYPVQVQVDNVNGSDLQNYTLNVRAANYANVASAAVVSASSEAGGQPANAAVDGV